jgi:hypothetical protein
LPIRASPSSNVHEAIGRLSAVQRRPLAVALLLKETEGPTPDRRAIGVALLRSGWWRLSSGEPAACRRLEVSFELRLHHVRVELRKDPRHRS